MKYTTEEHLELLQALDNHVRWLKEAHDDKGEFFFHIRKLEGLIGDLADYFNAKKKYVQREPDTQANPNSLGMYPGVPHEQRLSNERKANLKAMIDNRYDNHPHHKERMKFWAEAIDGKDSGWATGDTYNELQPYKDTEIEPKHRLQGKCGVAYSESYREKERLRKKYGDVFNENIPSSDATIGYVDERWK